ncbi:ROK family transcriptional regulator [Paenibacillus eucommiae]|uniref:N-acetylglucosamine repressor n=1 Tax=Paenibacillus eucommiae TaxID=1355755 RepID=A0ABS4J203_9BACL|nr:ROK family transcriptional regulator [Paenibacillus eucommiae]MBP1993857.1 N-acetylglucosamine repressor [Paenibacillus eucommiae]
MNLTETQLSILKLINLHREISRKELSFRSGLSQAAVTNITKELIEQKYIVEGRERISSGPGRKEVFLHSNPDRFRYLGIDIGGYRVRFAISDNNLNLLYQLDAPMADYLHEPNKLEALVSRINDFLQQNGVSPHSLDAIGVGVTGIVNTEQTRILDIPNVAFWDDLPIVSTLQQAYGCPVFLEEGGRTMALAERLVGQAKDVDNFMVVHFGKGIVAGMMINGHLIRGASNVGGLLGHITVDEKGPRCMCGNYGCLEMYGPFQIIEEKYLELDSTYTSLVEAYEQNNKIALDVCIEAGNSIGIALSNVVNLFNPQCIYLGGHLFDSLPLVLDELKRTVRRRANRFANVILEIEMNTFGDLEGIYGALTLAKSKLIS